MKKADEIRIIVEAAKNYQNRLNNRKFLIVYKRDEGIGSVEVGFHSMNFLHLTGLKTKHTA